MYGYYANLSRIKRVEYHVNIHINLSKHNKSLYLSWFL